MKWWRITVEIAEEQLDACAWLLAEALDQPVEIQDKDTLDLASASPMLVISCEVQPSAQQLAAIREVLAQLGQFDVPIEVQSREDKAWLEAWKSFFHTQIISPRFAVRPPWEPSIDHPHNIIIEPGMAFGTGTHPTTAGCLDMLDDVLGDAEAIRILDVGCGSSILAIAAALLGHHVVAIDNDPEAMTNAERNGELNRVSKHIEFFTCPRRTSPIRTTSLSPTSSHLC